MNKANILIAQNQDVYRIKVEGRANFESSPPLRNLAKNIINKDDVEEIQIDLKNCTGMDSTFMGVLAMLGLEARKLRIPVEVLNANFQNMDLLEGLGLKKLFRFDNRKTQRFKSQDFKNLNENADTLTTSKTVRDAHQSLVDANPEENLPKFEKVIDYANKDVEKLSEEKEKTDKEKADNKDDQGEEKKE